MLSEGRTPFKHEQAKKKLWGSDIPTRKQLGKGTCMVKHSLSFTMCKSAWKVKDKFGHAETRLH